jgi:peroxiredoxin Q/BCP
MTTSVRRSKRIASIKDDILITANKSITQEKSKITKSGKPAKVTKPKVESKKVQKTSVEKVITKEPIVGKLNISKKSKSRAAKKEDAVVLEDEDEDEDEDEEEEEEEEEEDKKELKVGDSLPKDLVLQLQDSKEINLLEYAKKVHILVIFAYPRASTPGCTRQAIGFRDEYKELHDELKATVLGLSADTPKAQTTFKTKQKLPYDLLCDTRKELCQLLGCKKYPTGIIRSHFIFVDGVLKVKKIKVSPEDSFKGALEQIKGLK